MLNKAETVVLKHGIQMIFATSNWDPRKELSALENMLQARAEETGRRVWQDLAVMGIDNLEVSALSRLSLTSIRQPYERIAELAAETLINSIENNRMPEISKSFEPELVIRRSTLINNPD